MTSSCEQPLALSADMRGSTWWDLTLSGHVQFREAFSVLSSSCWGIVGQDPGEDPHLPRAEVQWHRSLRLRAVCWSESPATVCSPFWGGWGKLSTGLSQQRSYPPEQSVSCLGCKIFSLTLFHSSESSVCFCLATVECPGDGSNWSSGQVRRIHFSQHL